MPPTTRPTNRQSCLLLRCSPDELCRLKSGFRAQLQAQHVNGQPFLGQVTAVADPDGSLREELWDTVAAEDAVLGSMLSAERWADGNLPAGFQERLDVVKESIFRDLNTAFRRAPKRKSGVHGEGGEMLSESNDRLHTRVTRRSERDGGGHGSDDGHGDESSLEVEMLAHCDTGMSVEPDEDMQSSQAPSSLHKRSTSPISVDAILPYAEAASSFPETGATTLPSAVRQIHDLESRVQTLEQELRQQGARIEERAMQRVQALLEERDRVIERLRWYLEGDA